MEHWYTKERTEQDGKPGWLFEIHQGETVHEQFLYDEGLALKLALGGYDSHGPTLAALWHEGLWIEYHPENWQCYIRQDDNPLHPVPQTDGKKEG